MASELSVRGKDEFEDLIRALEWGNEFAIYFVVVNPPLIRKHTAEELKRSLERKQIKVHSLVLNSFYFDLLSIIPEKVPSYCFRGVKTEIRSALFIFGVEEAIASDAETRRLFFDRLNWQRDKLRETIACPLIIWLPEFALRIFALEAPDFWAWRSGVYYLEPEPVWILKDTEELLKGGTSEYDVLTYQEKIRRLQQFKALLEDYERQPFGEELESELLGIQFYLFKEAGEVSFSLANYEEAKRHFLHGLKLAERLKDKKHFVSIFISLISTSAYQGDYISVEAKSFLEEILKINEEIGEKKGIVDNLRELSELAKRQGNIDEAIHKIEEAYVISNEIKDRGRVARILGIRGSLARAQGDYQKAQEFYEESLEIYEQLGDKFGIASLYLDLGGIAEDLGDYEEAKGRYKESLKMFNEIGARHLIALSRISLGRTYLKTEDFIEAERSFLDALEICECLGDSERIEIARQGLEQVKQDKFGKNKL